MLYQVLPAAQPKENRAARITVSVILTTVLANEYSAAFTARSLTDGAGGAFSIMLYSLTYGRTLSSQGRSVTSSSYSAL